MILGFFIQGGFCYKTRVQKESLSKQTAEDTLNKKSETLEGVYVISVRASVGKGLEVCSINHVTNRSVSIIQIKSPLMAAQCKHTKKITSCLLDKDGFT